MPSLPKNSYRRALLTGILLSMCLNSMVCLATWGSFSPGGSGATGGSDVLFFLILVVTFCTTFLALPFTVFRKTRPAALRSLLFCLGYTLVGWGALRASGMIWQWEMSEFGRRSAPLVEAIQQYEADHNGPPETLDQLVPAYLSEVPKADLGKYRTYQYSKDPNYLRTNTAERNAWALAVCFDSGWMDQPQFVYYPLKNYPTKSCQRLGEWAYLRD